jgi:hypothetical protein
VIVVVLAALSTTSSIFAQSASDGFNPDANALVQKVAVGPGNGEIVIGGGFTAIGGTTKNRIPRLRPNGIIDAFFNADVNGNVNAIAIQPDRKRRIGD